MSALTHSIKIKELVAHSYYMVQVFAENAVGLSGPLESNEPVQASITGCYIIQEIHMEEYFFRYKAEHLENTVWEPIYANSFFQGRRTLRVGFNNPSSSNTSNAKTPATITNDKVKFLQSKLNIK